jgi:hypothetical protein
MAKGQQRSNREPKKPKKAKVAASKPEATFGPQMRQDNTRNAPRRRSKN